MKIRFPDELHKKKSDDLNNNLKLLRNPNRKTEFCVVIFVHTLRVLQVFNAFRWKRRKRRELLYSLYYILKQNINHSFIHCTCMNIFNFSVLCLGGELHMKQFKFPQLEYHLQDVNTKKAF